MKSSSKKTGIFKVFDDAKIRNKIYLSFFCIIILGILAFGLLFQQMANINKTNEYLKTKVTEPNKYLTEAESHYQQAQIFKSLSMDSAFYGKDQKTIAEYSQKAKEEYDYAIQNIDEYIKIVSLLEDENGVVATEKAKKIQASVALYKDQFTKILMYAENGRADLSYDTNISAKMFSDQVDKSLSELIVLANELSLKLSDDMDKKLENLFVTSIIIMIVLIIGCFVVGLIISRSFDKKMKKLLKAVKAIAKGNFENKHAITSKDEFGELSDAIGDTADTVENIIGEIHAYVERQREGIMTQFIDGSKYQGDYAKMIEELNLSYKEIFATIKEFLRVMDALSNGDFSVEYPPQPNEKAVYNRAFDRIKSNFSSLNTELNSIVTSLSNGDFEVHADVSNFDGEWKEILVNLNRLVDNIKLPISEARDVLHELAEGDLSVKVEGKYFGSYNDIKVSLNTTIDYLHNIINSIAYTLNEIANKNLAVKTQGEFIGDFVQIKESIDDILVEFNNVLFEFKIGAGEVDMGGKQIADSSINLSERATEQANSIKQLTMEIEDVFNKTKENAQSSDEANKIAKVSLNSANEGDKKMKAMLGAMDGISASSKEIANIIKVIDDIAFQTNLLALNAAVEAARAGVHGKGFAVVAEEVRQLASRSSNAAKETSELIKKSMSDVSVGSTLATETNDALTAIVKSVAKMTKIIGDINVASTGQLDSIDAITNNLSLIEGTVTAVLAASEEGVSTAEELSSQSTVLKEHISEFRLGKE